MPQILLLAAVGAGLLLLRRYLKREQERIASDLRKAEEAIARKDMAREDMAPKDIETSVPLEQDPATGVYRPMGPEKHASRRSS